MAFLFVVRCLGVGLLDVIDVEMCWKRGGAMGYTLQRFC
jgi:hypothetical protein